MEKQWKQWETLFFWVPESLQMVTAAMKLKDACSLEEKLWPTFNSVQLLSHVQLFVIPCAAACQASLFNTNSWSVLKLTSIELVSVMSSNHLIICRSFLLQPSIFSSIRVFSDKSVLRIRWPKFWSFSFSISPSNEYLGLISFGMHWLNVLAV